MFDGSSLWHIESRKSKNALEMTGGLLDHSLASLLRGQRTFKKKEKMILSVILANSLLHFCESPWLSREWNKEHIMFFSTPTGKIHLQRPYLSTDFQAVATPLSDDEADEMFRIHPNPSILALGILLLEIELNTPIENKRTVEDLGESGEVTMNTNYFTASRLFQEDYSEDAYVNTKKAVDACLSCSFYEPETMDANLDNAEFRQAVYESIVHPLEKDLYNAYELTPDMIGLQAE